MKKTRPLGIKTYDELLNAERSKRLGISGICRGLESLLTDMLDSFKGKSTVYVRPNAPSQKTVFERQVDEAFEGVLLLRDAFGELDLILSEIENRRRMRSR